MWDSKVPPNPISYLSASIPSPYPFTHSNEINMHTLLPSSLLTCKVSNFISIKYPSAQNQFFNTQFYSKCLTIRSSSNKFGTPSTIAGNDAAEEPQPEDNVDRNSEERDIDGGVSKVSASTSSVPAIEKDLKKGYASMLIGGALSFNLIFPSNEPDIWRLMGMWSVWMFTIPSLRARDCSNKEKEALNYLFLLIPLLNVTIPFFWKSFAVVWSADIVAFLGMYAWKLGWLQKVDQ